jgi:hypothetical protein
MGEEEGAVRSSVAGQQGPPHTEQLRAETEATREDLGDIAAALAEKTDVKARAKEKAARVRQTISDKRATLSSGGGGDAGSGRGGAAAQVRAKAQDNPVPTAALAAFVGGLLFGRITKRG